MVPPPPAGAGFRCQPPESGLPGPGFPMRKAFTHTGEKAMEGLIGPLISFIGAVLIGIVVGKYIASKRK